MGLDLNFLEVWFSSSLSKDTLVLAAWSIWQVSHWWIVVRHGWNWILIVVLNFEVEHFKRLKHGQVIEVSWWVSLYLLQEGGDVGLILERELEQTLLDVALVEAESEFAVSDIVSRLVVINKPGVLGNFVVFCDTHLHLISCADTMALNPVPNLLKSVASPDSADQLIGDSEEDGYKSSSHSEMVVLKGIPSWFGSEVIESGGVDDYFLLINFSFKSTGVVDSHFFLFVVQNHLSFSFNIIDESISVRRVTNALEELDTFFSFELLKFPVLLDKLLLVS